MAFSSVNVKNLEQIQEAGPTKPTPRLAAFLLASLAGTALVFAGIMLNGRDSLPRESTNDPLAELVSNAKNEGTPAHELSAADVSFPELLSDREAPTTALAAVKDERGRLLKQSDAVDQLAALPPAADRLPVVPLPAGTLMNATPVTTEPKDQLTELAVRAATDKANSADQAPPGADTGYQIQVASFKDQADADAFVLELRKRGHEAFRVAAMVPARGLWHRVRVGPFKTKYQAVQYKQKFERTERVSPFVVDPHQVKQAEEIRQRKLEARRKKYGSQ